jgi:hypothetical protein
MNSKYELFSVGYQLKGLKLIEGKYLEQPPEVSDNSMTKIKEKIMHLEIKDDNQINKVKFNLYVNDNHDNHKIIVVKFELNCSDNNNDNSINFNDTVNESNDQLIRDTIKDLSNFDKLGEVLIHNYKKKKNRYIAILNQIEESNLNLNLKLDSKLENIHKDKIDKVLNNENVNTKNIKELIFLLDKLWSDRRAQAINININCGVYDYNDIWYYHHYSDQHQYDIRAPLLGPSLILPQIHI